MDMEQLTPGRIDSFIEAIQPFMCDDMRARVFQDGNFYGELKAVEVVRRERLYFVRLDLGDGITIDLPVLADGSVKYQLNRDGFEIYMLVSGQPPCRTTVRCT
jgi:hypothetical protein